MIVSRFVGAGLFLAQTNEYFAAYLPPLLRAKAPTANLDTLRSRGGSFAFRSIDVTAKNGQPCKKCGGNEWYANGRCAPCWREGARQWAKNNPDKRNEKSRRWKKAHPEKIAADTRRWRKNNPEKASASAMKWKKDNPEKNTAMENRRRALKTKAGGSYTGAEWNALVDHYGGKCLCCGRTDVKLTADHIIPVSLGGTSNIDNIQPLCKQCNSSKWNKTVDYRPTSGIGRWVQRKLFG